MNDYLKLTIKNTSGVLGCVSSQDFSPDNGTVEGLDSATRVER